MGVQRLSPFPLVVGKGRNTSCGSRFWLMLARQMITRRTSQLPKSLAPLALKARRGLPAQQVLVVRKVTLVSAYLQAATQATFS